MPERQSRHPDNKLIADITEGATPSQSGSSGGEVTPDGLIAVGDPVELVDA